MSDPADDFDRSGIDLDRVWTSVAAEVWRRHHGPIERVAGRLLRSPGLARALLTTPTLLLPWLISTVVIFTAGGLFDLFGGQPLVWLLAPGLAAIAIAYSYGPGVDPTWELGCSMPVSERMVLLVRAVAVFAVNAILGLTVSALSYLVMEHGTSKHSSTGHVAAMTAAQAATITFAWVIPMTAICALTLAVAVIARSANAGAAVGISAWACTVLVSRSASGAFTAAVTNSSTYLPYLVVAACAMVVIGYATRTQRGAS